jgi:N-acetylmuramoyl-L-alanine amidase
LRKLAIQRRRQPRFCRFWIVTRARHRKNPPVPKNRNGKPAFPRARPQFVLPLIAAAACGLAGCRSGHSHLENKQVIPLTLPATPEPAPIAITNTPPPVEQPVPPVVEQPPAVPDNTTVPAFVDTWLPLDQWCDAVGVARPRLIHENASRTYVLPTASGPATLTAGSRVSQWDGIHFWLGHAPRLANQQLVIHAADAQKSLLPLLTLHSAIAGPNRCVVIDPGHGGRSVGTKNVATGLHEKDYTLDWALRLKNILATNGWKVVLTRSNDTDVALSNRVAMAEQAQASLFISLHFNSGDSNPGRQGIETYCLTPVGLPSSLARDEADEKSNLNAVFPNHTYDVGNLQYALKIHRRLIRQTGLQDQGVQRARFMAVLKGQNRPAVLIEGGYLSNPKEARLIADPKFRQKLAAAVAQALME